MSDDRCHECDRRACVCKTTFVEGLRQAAVDHHETAVEYLQRAVELGPQRLDDLAKAHYYTMLEAAARWLADQLEANQLKRERQAS